MKKIDQKGFSVVEGVLILLFITALAVGGWWIVHSRNTKNDAPGGSSRQTTAPTPQPTTETPKPAAKTLSIKELGIVLRLDDKIKDLKYTYETQAAGSGSYFDHWLNFSSPTIDVDSDCAGAMGHSLGQFGVATAATQPSINANEATLELHTSNYYIYYPHPQAATCGKDASAMNKSSEYTSLVIDALKAAKAQ